MELPHDYSGKKSSNYSVPESFLTTFWHIKYEDACSCIHNLKVIGAGEISNTALSTYTEDLELMQESLHF